MESIRKIDKLMVNLEELQDILSCGRRRAEKVAMLAQAEVRIGKMRRFNIERLKEFLYNEAM